MYINPESIPPTRTTFYRTILIGYVVSIGIITASESNDDLLLGYWALVGSTLFTCVGLFILYGGKLRDKVFGFSVCPNCGKNGWDIKQKLKITHTKSTNIGRCNICKRKGAISYIHTIPLIVILLLWVPIMIYTNSISIASLVTYMLYIGYFIYYGRFVRIRK